MLYSEKKERENRFITALKIVFPLLLLIGIFFHSFSLFPYTSINFFLLILLIPIYVYYTVYLIYYGFQTTLIDPITKTFTRNEILLKIKKNKDPKSLIILLHVNNLNDINERYGIANGDLILRALIKQLELFLEEYRYKNIAIGRYNHDSFLFLVNASSQEFKHLFTIFTKRIQNNGLQNIEVKLSFSLLEAQYDTNVSYVIERLFMLIEKNQVDKEVLPHIQLHTFKKNLSHAFRHDGIAFKYQPALHVKEEKTTLFEVLTRIYTEDYGVFTKGNIQNIVNRMGLERALDEQIIASLLAKIDPFLPKKEFLLSLEISPVTLRNSKFKHYLLNLFKQKELHPNRFILEIVEEKSYEEMQRFKEIIESYQEMGFKIALGNFGGNNCGFEYLKYLPIDLIKFDIEFTKKIEDIKYQKLLKSYIDLAKTLQIQTMVKFVDKESTLKLIKACEPDFIQGFCISKPKSIKEFNDEVW